MMNNDEKNVARQKKSVAFKFISNFQEKNFHYEILKDQQTSQQFKKTGIFLKFGSFNFINEFINIFFVRFFLFMFPKLKMQHIFKIIYENNILHFFSSIEIVIRQFISVDEKCFGTRKFWHVAETV